MNKKICSVMLNENEKKYQCGPVYAGSYICDEYKNLTEYVKNLIENADDRDAYDYGVSDTDIWGNIPDVKPDAVFVTLDGDPFIMFWEVD